LSIEQNLERNVRQCLLEIEDHGVLPQALRE